MTAGIAVIEPDQSPSSAFRVTQLTPIAAITSVARQSDGKILAAGELFRLDGGPGSGILRFQVDGTIDDSFKLLPDGAVADQIAVDAEDRIVMSGFIPNSIGYGMTLARFLPDGSVDGSFSGPNPTTAPIALQLDGKVITIETICMNNCMSLVYRVARYLSDGSADSSFSGPNVTLLTGTVPVLGAIAVQSDGKVVIGGEFSLLGTTAQPNCGRLNEDGTVDDGFHPLVDSAVNTITVQGNGKIVIAGSFSSVNGVPVDGVARLNSDGSLDPTLGIPSVDGVAFASAQFTNGEIIVEGEFGVATSIAKNWPISQPERLSTVGTMWRAHCHRSGAEDHPGASDWSVIGFSRNRESLADPTLELTKTVRSYKVTTTGATVVTNKRSSTARWRRPTPRNRRF